jgi:hypothetical protein
VAGRDSRAKGELVAYHQPVARDHIRSAVPGTPVLVVANRQKTKAFVADAGLPMSINSIAAVTPEIVAECLSGRAEILDAMQRYLVAAQRKAFSPFPTTVQ